MYLGGRQEALHDFKSQCTVAARSCGYATCHDCGSDHTWIIAMQRVPYMDHGRMRSLHMLAHVQLGSLPSALSGLLHKPLSANSTCRSHQYHAPFTNIKCAHRAAAATGPASGWCIWHVRFGKWLSDGAWPSVRPQGGVNFQLYKKHLPSNAARVPHMP